MLRYAYLKSSVDPTLLLWGDRDDMRALAGLLRSVPEFQTERTLAELGCHAQTGATVFIRPCQSGAQGLRKVEGGDGAFRWELDRNHASHFAELAEVLAARKQGHHYLECGSGDEIAVKASCGEYPDDFLIG